MFYFFADFNRRNKEKYKLMSKFYVLLICLLWLSTASTRRRKCIPRLCRRCDMYLHSRWRRSASHPPVPHFDVDTDIDSFSSQSKSLDYNRVKSFLEKVGLSRYTHHIANNFWETKPPNYDVEEKESIDESRKEMKKRIRVRKRSAGHVRQCRRLLMTVCCRVFYTPIYIGYRF